MTRCETTAGRVGRTSGNDDGQRCDGSGRSAWAGTDPGAAAAPLATLSVDLGQARGRFPFGLGRQLSATPKSWRYAAETTAALDQLRLERVRVWLKYIDIAPAGSGPPRYDTAYPYLDYYRDRAGALLLNWQTGYDTYAETPGFDLEAFVRAQYQALAHYKQRYPTIGQVEVENENFPSGGDVGRYYPKYVVMYRAVNAVNAPGAQ